MLPTDILTAIRPAEAERLQELARGQVVLECGAFYGYSTVVLASVAAHVHSVDWHHGDKDAGAYETLQDYMANLTRYDVADRVTAHVGRFEQILPMLRASSFDGCFLDGQHDRASVDRDLEMVRRLMRRPSWIAVHDYGLFDVKPALDDFVRGHGYRYEGVIETLAVVRSVHPARTVARRLPPPIKRGIKLALRAE
jgi:hypothetical protein